MSWTLCPLVRWIWAKTQEIKCTRGGIETRCRSRKRVEAEDDDISPSQLVQTTSAFCHSDHSLILTRGGGEATHSLLTPRKVFSSFLLHITYLEPKLFSTVQSCQRPTVKHPKAARGTKTSNPGRQPKVQIMFCRLHTPARLYGDSGASLDNVPNVIGQITFHRPIDISFMCGRDATEMIKGSTIRAIVASDWNANFYSTFYIHSLSFPYAPAFYYIFRGAVGGPLYTDGNLYQSRHDDDF